jgi:hypothetical protein
MSTESQSPDELDRLLGTYLKAQLPNRWPDAPNPSESTHSVAADTSSRSRLTLALSAAALLGFGLVLSTGSRPLAGPNAVGPHENLLPSSTADGGKLFRTATTGKN